MTALIAFFALTVLGMLMVRVNLIESRGPYYNPDRDIHGATIGFLTMASVFALLAYGFVAFRWYWPVLAFIAGTVVQFPVRRDNLGALLAIRIPVEIAVIIGAIALWVGHLTH